MIGIESQQSVYSILRKLRGLEQLKKLFWSELNYDHVNQLLPGYGVYRSQMKDLAEDPILFATGGAEGDFHIIYIRMQASHLELSQERPIVFRLLQDHPYSLFIFSNFAQDQWHFLNVKYDINNHKRRLFRRITISSNEQLRTASQRISFLDLEIIGQDQDTLTALAIQQKHDEAFDVEAVTKQFFGEYKSQFYQLQSDLYRQTNDTAWAHDYALQFLNRCMFLYFIQRKRWLGGDPEFLRSFWESYKSSEQPCDSFIDRWLKVMFFEAFNNKFCDNYDYFPQPIREALITVPYLNGGLFTENALDRSHSFTITDICFLKIFNFLEHYNFTITEDSPLDQEVAVDPEMIGKVYESLVNVTTEVDERSNAGIFYTPRVEIDLMCRLALVDNLSNHLGVDHKQSIYELVFALEADEKIAADSALTKEGLWSTLYNYLREITVVDPSCGSGAFLVGMLYILDDINARAAKQLSLIESSYERKKRIIGQSLYGVDVMEWAIHIAELRLWLALIIDAPLTLRDLNAQREPLLPYFTFKLCCGDSLLSDLHSLRLRSTFVIPTTIQSSLDDIKIEKLKFYNNDPHRRFQSDQDLRDEELRVFRELIENQKQAIQEQINILRRKKTGPQEQQLRLDVTMEAPSPQIRQQAVEWQKQEEKLLSELERLERIYDSLNFSGNIPFAWDIAFVEIFKGKRQGFDIVIGNPPYVRQEHIAPPHLPVDKVTPDSKKTYKAKLVDSVYQAFPSFFGHNGAKDTVARNIDAKSDLYIYFYFLGLSLLNNQGTFCFITSNSWLDVGYGGLLQEFLLKYCHIKMVIDNQAKRSFKSAGVNTTIVLFSSPQKPRDFGFNQTARFVMFKLPFEQVISPVLFEEIEDARSCFDTKEYRVFPIEQKILYEEGCELPEVEKSHTINIEEKALALAVKQTNLLFRNLHYTNNKWGGKYLRAPNIYWVILEKGKDILRRLGDTAEVKRGFTTGANEFFYLDGLSIAKWGIEEEFLLPVIKSPRECKRIYVEAEDLKFKVFICNKDRKALSGSAALEYIEWGESQAFHKRATCATRIRWWSLPQGAENSIFVKEANDTSAVFYNAHKYLVDCRLYFANLPPQNILYLNSAIGAMLFEIYNRAGLGEGARSMMVSDYANVPALGIPIATEKEIDGVLDILYTQHPRKLSAPTEGNWIYLDMPIFEVLRLTQNERDAVYEAVVNLANARLMKAKSLDGEQ